jgi:hypothetical protein
VPVAEAEAVTAEVEPGDLESVEGPALANLAPKVGVEILNGEQGKPKQSHVIRDLRNGMVIRNVTRKSARKLWSYAISQYETNPIDAEKVQWQGDIGLWQASKRAGKMRYDLVQRAEDGLHVYYGVTEDGMDGPWRQFLVEEDRK